MFRRLFLSNFGLLFAAAFSAQAITIVPGNTYQGTVSFGPDNLQGASCCPVVPGSVTLNSAQQYYVNTGAMAVGTTFTATLLDLAGNLLSSVTWGPTSSAHAGGLGLSLGLIDPTAALPASGLFQITASGASVDVNSVDVAMNYNATVQHPTLGALATNLLSINPVTNLALLQPTGGGGNSGGTPSAVPLPAPLVLLLAAIGSMFWVRRRAIA